MSGVINAERAEVGTVSCDSLLTPRGPGGLELAAALLKSLPRCKGAAASSPGKNWAAVGGGARSLRLYRKGRMRTAPQTTASATVYSEGLIDGKTIGEKPMPK